MGWETKSHKNTTKEVKSEISKLHDCDVEVELSWSPGHANIKGNEYADQLAKEAAQEAKDAEDLRAVTSFGDVKFAAKESGIMKWHERWEASDRGRTCTHSGLRWDIKFNIHLFHQSGRALYPN